MAMVTRETEEGLNLLKTNLGDLELCYLAEVLRVAAGWMVRKGNCFRVDSRGKLGNQLTAKIGKCIIFLDRQAEHAIGAA